MVWHAIGNAHHLLGNTQAALTAVQQGLTIIQSQPHYAGFAEVLLKLQQRIQQQG